MTNKLSPVTNSLHTTLTLLTKSGAVNRDFHWLDCLTSGSDIQIYMYM